ncbi:DEAD/DEAH box helicase [Treponema parvum]|uniref:DEAD/DEAH box helicase n=1 Tax=Treponema parvum TaxID=138851 RepID=A0A975IEA8_9SPIR|nr:DEAD/DEAH box helicase [Treponema parvum]QTQ13693.1 DEAD/DEAH box helicase [Treponema parvum]
MDFLEFSLHDDLQKGIKEAGYVSCTPVQERVLKSATGAADLYVQSQTGTGKTAAYLIAIAQELLVRPEIKGKKALVLVPTRELAVQVEDEAKKLLKYTSLRPFSFYGGVGYEAQVAALKKNVEILIGTPGRVIDLVESKRMALSDVGFLVVDEADRMFDMGFYPDLRTLIKHLPSAENRQTMLFSATLNSYVKNLAWEYTLDAEEIQIESENIVVSEIAQELLHVSSDEKVKLLLGILQKEKPSSAIIFCNTKRGCEVLGKKLKINGIRSDFLIGDMIQSKRLKVLEDFKASRIPVLVATDVAARGIDVSDLAMVVNYDLPNEAENYVHRIGRTARAGKSGKAYTFCSEQDVYNLPAIERFIEMKIPSRVADESLFAEDKSEGVYIRTERRGGGDFDRSASRTRRPRSEESSRRGRPFSKKTESGSRFKKDKNKFSGEERRQDSGREGSKKYGQRERLKGFQTSKDLEKLENLSFDERMKLYRQKYAPGTSSMPKAAPQKGAVRSDGRRKNTRKVSSPKKPGFLSKIMSALGFDQKNKQGKTK